MDTKRIIRVSFIMVLILYYIEGTFPSIFVSVNGRSKIYNYGLLPNIILCLINQLPKKLFVFSPWY